MRAALRVQARVGNAQALHRTAGDQMLAHNVFRVLWLHPAVPDGVRIDNDSGPVLALVKAARFVDAHLAAQTGLARKLLQPRVQRAGSIARAGGPRRIGGARIETNKNVSFKWGHNILSVRKNLGRIPASEITHAVPSISAYLPFFRKF